MTSLPWGPAMSIPACITRSEVYGSSRTPKSLVTQPRVGQTLGTGVARHEEIVHRAGDDDRDEHRGRDGSLSEPLLLEVVAPHLGSGLIGDDDQRECLVRHPCSSQAQCFRNAECRNPALDASIN